MCVQTFEWKYAFRPATRLPWDARIAIPLKANQATGARHEGLGPVSHVSLSDMPHGRFVCPTGLCTPLPLQDKKTRKDKREEKEKDDKRKVGGIRNTSKSVFSQ